MPGLSRTEAISESQGTGGGGVRNVQVMSLSNTQAGNLRYVRSQCLACHAAPSHDPAWCWQCALPCAIAANFRDTVNCPEHSQHVQELGAKF